MPTMIDGYNLLHVSGLFGTGRGPGGFERARRALMNFVAASMTEKEIGQSIIVFDAHDAPPGLPREVDHRGLKVRYASGYESADALLEELIANHHAPRQLTVVSSDHRVQRAARKRKANAIDSDIWYAEAIRNRRTNAGPSFAVPAKPTAAPTKAEVEFWLEEFADAPPLDMPPVDVEPRNTTSDKTKRSEAKKKKSKKGKKGKNEIEPDLNEMINPFPPGYGEDLL